MPMQMANIKRHAQARAAIATAAMAVVELLLSTRSQEALQCTP